MIEPSHVSMARKLQLDIGLCFGWTQYAIQHLRNNKLPVGFPRNIEDMDLIEFVSDRDGIWMKCSMNHYKFSEDYKILVKPIEDVTANESLTIQLIEKWHETKTFQ